MEEKILEIIKEHNWYDTNRQHFELDYPNAAKEITAHVFEFMNWVVNNCETNNGNNNDKWYVYKLAAEEKDCFLDSEELYQYWFKEVKK